MPIKKTTSKKEKIKPMKPKKASLAGSAEKKKQSSVANRTRKVSTPTKENVQKPRSQFDSDAKSVNKSHKNHGKSLKLPYQKRSTGRGTEVSNKTLADRTKRDLKEVTKARAKDTANKAAKKAATKTVVKTVAKTALKRAGVIGAAATAAEALYGISKRAGEEGRAKRGGRAAGKPSGKSKKKR